MKWAWKVGEYAGIGVFIHVTFVLILVWAAVGEWMRLPTVASALGGVAFVLAIFACVVMHEFGHALMARRYGIRTRDITLYPIGGIARLERMPDKPIQEFWVAIAGPAVNVAIAALLFGVLWLMHRVGGAFDLTLTQGSFLSRLLVVNVFLVAFNMLPAFPMDGGRVLRALLALRLEYSRATRIAAIVGRVMAAGFGILGFMSGNFVLMFIAVFVWMGAGQEASLALMKRVMTGVPVSRAMITDFRALAASSTLADAAQLLVAGSQHDFPVLGTGGNVEGILMRSDLLAALQSVPAGTPVPQLMRTSFDSAEVDEPLESAFPRLAGSECPVMPVLRNGALAGILTPENVGEFYHIQDALRSRPPAIPQAAR
jgi:Zn-dependent protease